MPIYHFLYYGYEKTVIDSQVITPARLLEKEGISVRHFTVHRIPRNFLYLNTVLLFFFFLKHLFSRERIVVHTRGLQGAAVLLPLKKIFRNMRVICDVRGLEADEYDFEARQGNKKRPLNFFQSLWKRHLEKVTAYAIQKSDRVFFVSQSMIEYMAKKFPGAKKMNWRYIPCAVETGKFDAALKEREVLRRKLGVSGRVVVTYAGGNRLWQGIDQVAFLFARIKELAPNAVFLGITKEYDVLKSVFTAQGLSSSDCIIEQVPYDEIPNYMVCADLGILIRANIPLNNYACPTKFAEYLASGLHVVTTEAIFDIVRIVRDENVGTVLSDFSHYETLRADINEALKQAADPKRIERSVDAAKKWLDWSAYLPKLKETYMELQ